MQQPPFDKTQGPPPKDLNEAFQQGQRPVFTEGEDWTQPFNWRKKMIHNKEHQPKSCIANGHLVLVHHEKWKGLLGYNTHSLKVVWLKSPPWDADDEKLPDLDLRSESCAIKPGAELKDEHGTRISTWLHRHEGVHLNKSQALEAAIIAAQTNSFHPVCLYLDGLTWDRKPRLDTWMHRLLGAADDPYTRKVSAAFLISAVARVRRPGIKADCLPILEGPQGIGKSTALSIIAVEWFTDELADLGSKDSALQLQGRWLVELSELDTLSRAEVARIKAFLSRTTDRFRPPYGRTVEEHPRQCVFAGTCNTSEYLRDEAGGRRFWPIRCGKIDLEGLRAERDQLWAEACARFKAGEQHWLSGEALQIAEEEQSARYHADAWEEIIAVDLKDRPWITLPEILEGTLKIDKGKWSQLDQNRVVRCLKRLGWERRRAREAKAPVWRYYPPTAPEPEPEQ